ncbi:serine hydroxymethyltransferase [Clostridioides difficile]|uniref:serine hydroxymethyltransferase n=1 Tax=Clostridioides difficile TaxID=1496 RepID=UPI0002F4F70B|nr:serine hydroxymethyltransferase [Clostridioides difficile]MDC0804665.1 serine hydroxymethyltransferase [Clostridium paraputrificum]AXU51105.1 serine hydroxymethyltransferase [Clostridioides difficile]EGT2200694.1 aminotransferase class I/II-fold pyridoxal phosphate-dependent enzyme [Clostridioides difficile]EGT4049050.1 serine hydroxymethyltransferase [Clostridioides difficile]EGT4223257.1 serine hydroxymethyltransferase [Clostridioides difficile]
MLKTTKISDPELYKIVADELVRQEHNIEMIASESTAPTEVLELSGCVFTNKTEEGYPGARFQAGSEEADKLEILAIKRAKEVFGAEHVNVQPYSGSTANYCVYSSILKPNDTVLSMRLDQGGHLTHGSTVNFLHDIYKYEFYGVDPNTGRIDYDALEAKAKECRPKLIIAGASSYPRLIDYERISKVAKEVGAYFMVDMAHVAGLVAAKVIPSPVPYADFVSSSTTKTFCGPRSGIVLCKAEHAKKLDKGVFPGTLGSIHLNTVAAKAFSLLYLSTDKFKKIMEQVVVNAQTLASELISHGFSIVSGGTDNHIVMVDLRSKNLTGKQFEKALEYVGITVNKNVIPDDPQSPFVTSGVRIGLTSISQRGLKEKEVVQIAGIMNKVAENIDNKEILDECKSEAQELISKFPLYPEGYFED